MLSILFEQHRRINTQNEETAMNERNTLLCIDEGKERNLDFKCVQISITRGQWPYRSAAIRTLKTQTEPK